MKKIILAIFGLFVTFAASAQIRQATLSASGLTCSMCSKAIYKALSKVPFVASVDPDIEGSKYSIKFKDGANIELDKLKDAVENAGFSVASLQVTGIFPPMDIADDQHIEYAGNVYHFLHVGKQKIAGEKTFTVVDKSFLPTADYKRYTKYTTMKCVETGHMEACCQNGKKGARVYHITL